MTTPDQATKPGILQTEGDFPAFFRLAKNLVRKVMIFNPSDSNGLTTFGTPNEILEEEPSLEEANAVGSQVHPKHHLDDMHKVVLDLDMDAALIPSSTEGHHHLIIEKYMPWPRYEAFLKDMAKYGIISQGYADFSVARKASWIRTPGTKKGMFQ